MAEADSSVVLSDMEENITKDRHQVQARSISDEDKMNIHLSILFTR